MNNIINTLTHKMILFNNNDPKRIQHLIKVHSFAKLICEMENVDLHTKFITECASLVHDIGIKPAEQKYGKCNGKLQEQEGPTYAYDLLTELNFKPSDIDRICYLIGHHHTYNNIDGLDYQIVVEADFLVNFYEDGLDKETIKKTVNKIFKTPYAIKLCSMIYNLRL